MIANVLQETEYFAVYVEYEEASLSRVERGFLLRLQVLGPLCLTADTSYERSGLHLFEN
jgi:hypothetical protein